MKEKLVAVAATVGVGAAVVAAMSAGMIRDMATVVSLYGAFVVVMAGFPGRRPVVQLAYQHVSRRTHHT